MVFIQPRVQGFVPTWGIVISVVAQFTSTALCLPCPLQKHPAPQMSLEAPVWVTVGWHEAATARQNRGSFACLKHLWNNHKPPGVKCWH